MNRREFAFAATAASLAAKSDTVNICLMGVGGRGKTLAKWFGELPDVRIPIICDVDENVVGPAMKA
ncbi:MAG TPA: hypothetical protein VFQ91_22070, partial [Bryobacteraceae bacterium]|nr:hypothetical protein [Bryobacteraceae bacterium]